MSKAELIHQFDTGKDYPLNDIDRCIELQTRMRRPNYTIMDNGVITEVIYHENGRYTLRNSDGEVLGTIRKDTELTYLHNEDLKDIMNLVIQEDHPHRQILDIFKERAAAVLEARRLAILDQYRSLSD